MSGNRERKLVINTKQEFEKLCECGKAKVFMLFDGSNNCAEINGYYIREAIRVYIFDRRMTKKSARRKVFKCSCGCVVTNPQVKEYLFGLIDKRMERFI